MRRKRNSSSAPPAAPKEFHNQPFRELKQVLPVAVAPTLRPVVAPPPEAPPPAVLDDGDLFRSAVAGVKPLSVAARERIAMPPPAAERREITDPDAEALAELCDLVSGVSPFDISDSDEYVEGAVVGLDRHLVRRLRQGEFAYQAHLDLHGMTSDEARVVLDRFLVESCHLGRRCVLIIHGRGLNSVGQVPVLKRRVATWLAHGRWSRHVLAFTSARAYDGGAGAVYVLLRRSREGRQTIRVTNRSKV